MDALAKVTSEDREPWIDRDDLALDEPTKDMILPLKVAPKLVVVPHTKVLFVLLTREEKVCPSPLA